MESPFLCGSPLDPDPEAGVECPTDRPADRLLSCDAIGCHGGFEFAAERTGLIRHLYGSEGPSCYTRHGEEWNEEGDD